MPYQLDDRFCTLNTTLGRDVLILRSMGAVEGISQLFSCEMDLVSHEGEIEFEQIVGKPVCAQLLLGGGGSRYFHGIVSRFSQGGESGVGDEQQGLVSYQAEVVPWLWTLTRSTNCRVFEDKSAPDIIKAVFDHLGYRENEDYEFSSLGETHDPIEYSVQYLETDFDFVSRLMEEEGLAYYFRHEQDKHTMVIFDTSATCPDCSGYESMLYGGSAATEGDERQIEEWSVVQQMPPGKCAVNGYDFKNPSDELLAPTATSLSMGGNSKYEAYDYPSNYIRSADGQRYVRFRMEAQEAASHEVHGRACYGAFTAGSHITLERHYRSSFNGQRYLLTQVQHSITQSLGREGAHSSYENSFTCLPERIPYRSLQTTPKPSIHGSQTALVVGPSGEEIHCDEYGRVRIQFYWDRDGKSDGTDVCWARVAQVSAGRKWGALFTPRIGQEVVVTFLDGDPDRPLITGVVYNAEQMPPYDLDANKTQSGWKTRSSKSGNPDTFNEIKFEDKKGSESISIHAEKDMSISVENDQSISVDHDLSQTVKHDQTETVENDSKETVKNNKTIIIDGTHTETIKKDTKVTVSQGNLEQTVTAGTLTRKVAGDVSDTFQAGHTETVTATYSLSAQKVEITGMTEISLTVGGNSIKIDASGITIQSSATVTVTAAMIKHNA